MKRVVALLSIVSLLFISCNPYKYSTPVVMPAGKSELKKRQIRRGY